VSRIRPRRRGFLHPAGRRHDGPVSSPPSPSDGDAPVRQPLCGAGELPLLRAAPHSSLNVARPVSSGVNRNVSIHTRSRAARMASDFYWKSSAPSSNRRTWLPAVLPEGPTPGCVSATMPDSAVHRPSRRCQSDFFGGQAQRWSRGTPASACSTCRPHPAHVGLPHLLHSTRRHIGRSSIRLQVRNPATRRGQNAIVVPPQRKNPGGHPGFFVVRRTAWTSGWPCCPGGWSRRR
jgi:hypothetical protein